MGKVSIAATQMNIAQGFTPSGMLMVFSMAPSALKARTARWAPSVKAVVKSPDAKSGASGPMEPVPVSAASANGVRVVRLADVQNGTYSFV
jgi:hypothetical protein